MNQPLIDTLGEVGKSTHEYHCPDGTQLLLLPHGGRILGLFAGPGSENFFWTHPALGAPSTAAGFYASDQWHNSGGDRTWLAPEVDFFFPKFPQTKVYWQPRQLDPGDWKIDVLSDTVRMTNRLTCRLSRSHTDVEVEITKSVLPAPNPLRNDGGWKGMADVQYAGYTLRTSLELLGDSSGQKGPVGLWNLTQMPHDGDLLVPTCGPSDPKIVFGDVPAQDIMVGERLIRYAMRAGGAQKISIRALAATGRIGYRYPAENGRWALVVRNVFVNPSGEYVDVPFADVEDKGYAVQACNVHNELGRFSELEYHSPAIGAGTGLSRGEDLSQTWAFRGSREAIDRIVARLLTP